MIEHAANTRLVQLLVNSRCCFTRAQAGWQCYTCTQSHQRARRSVLRKSFISSIRCNARTYSKLLHARPVVPETYDAVLSPSRTAFGLVNWVNKPFRRIDHH